MRRALGLAALAVAVAVPHAIEPARASRGADPLEEAHRAAAQTPFEGRVSVEWREGTVVHHDQLDVKGKGGAFVAAGGRTAMALGGERLVFRPGDGWHELWPAGLGGAGQPTLEDAYDVRFVGPGSVAQYETEVYELWKGPVRRETLDLEKGTKLLLRRRQYDAQGVVERAFAFDQVRISDQSITAPTVPPAPKHDGPQSMSATGLGGADQAPARLAAGYRRVGAYRQAGVTQLVYGDGLYDLSLFEQHGRVESVDLPSQRRSVRLRGRQAWQFSWAGGEGLVWTAGATVYTLVGDVPPDELMLVASSVPVHRSTSITHRLRQACRTLVESFTGGR